MATGKTVTNHMGSALSVADVAARLDVSKRTASRLIETGELKAHHIRRQWRIFESDLQDYLARQANRSSSELGGQAAA